jgi:GTPase SAR1 family protein
MRFVACAQDTAGEEKFDSLTNFCEFVAAPLLLLLQSLAVSHLLLLCPLVDTRVCSLCCLRVCVCAWSDCRNATAALVCYDITNYETFANLQRWVDKIQLEAEKNCRSADSAIDNAYLILPLPFP